MPLRVLGRGTSRLLLLLSLLLFLECEGGGPLGASEYAGGGPMLSWFVDMMLISLKSWISQCLRFVADGIEEASCMTIYIRSGGGVGRFLEA